MPPAAPTYERRFFVTTPPIRMGALFSAYSIDPIIRKSALQEAIRSIARNCSTPLPCFNKRETFETSRGTITGKRPNAGRAIVEWTIDAVICEESGRWHNGHVRIPPNGANRAGLASINRTTGEASVIEKSPDDDGMCTGQMLAHVRRMNRAGKLEQSGTLSWH